MAEKKAIEVALRLKRQITLPREVCEQLRIAPGDKLELILEGDVLMARPKKVVALEALKEIREAFERSGITEEELQEAGRQVREKVFKERYATKI
ncbi:MAG: AbrB/MazE/SpoVT family DNA-binding domain-containing protein [Deltaproteobacteria bacterium]|nr:AbrB/MazE/SpoVT family DNA-binding domain-containing protein [Deltaproteobacteria bacterium]